MEMEEILPYIMSFIYLKVISTDCNNVNTQGKTKTKGIKNIMNFFLITLEGISYVT